MLWLTVIQKTQLLGQWGAIYLLEISYLFKDLQQRYLGQTNGTVVPSPGGCPDLSLTSSGEALFAYQGAAPTSTSAAAQTNFIAAINMNGGWDINATSTSTSAKPAVFTDGVNSLSISPEMDDAVFIGSLSGDVNTLRTAINNSASWQEVIHMLIQLMR